MKKIIFDTDLGGDCDDVMALDLLLACEKRGECELIGVTYSADARNSVPCIHSILRQHGRSSIPIGRAPVKEGIKPVSDVYATKVTQAFQTPDTLRYEDAYDAVALLRKLLAENQGITLCVTGYLTNIAALLLSRPDEYSPLDGISLAAEKITEVAVMGCSFVHQNGESSAFPEWNIKCDIKAAQTVMSLCPSPVVICPFEVGLHMITGAPMTARGGKDLPDSFCYIVHGSTGGRDSWDPATALYAVRGCTPYYKISAPGYCTVDDDGISYFEENGGCHRILSCAMEQAEIAAEIDETVSFLWN